MTKSWSKGKFKGNIWKYKDPRDLFSLLRRRHLAAGDWFSKENMDDNISMTWWHGGHVEIIFGICKSLNGEIWVTRVITQDIPHGDEDVSMMSLRRSAFRRKRPSWLYFNLHSKNLSKRGALIYVGIWSQKLKKSQGHRARGRAPRDMSS